MTFETEKKKPKALLPIRLTALYGREPPTQRVEKTPEPAKVEAPVTPTPTPEGLSRTYGRPTTPLSQTRGIEQAKQKGF